METFLLFIIKGTVLSSFTHLHTAPNQYDFLSCVEHKRIYCEKCFNCFDVKSLKQHWTIVFAWIKIFSKKKKKKKLHCVSQKKVKLCSKEFSFLSTLFNYSLPLTYQHTLESGGLGSVNLLKEINTFKCKVIILQRFSISNECCSSEFYIQQSILGGKYTVDRIKNSAFPSSF